MNTYKKNNHVFNKVVIGKLSHWLWFSVVIAVMPILFNLWRLYGSNYNQDLPAEQLVLSHGVSAGEDPLLFAAV